MKIVSDYYDCIDYLQDYNDPRTFVRRCEVFGDYKYNEELIKSSDPGYALTQWFRDKCIGYWQIRGVCSTLAPVQPIPEDLNSYAVFVSMFDPGLTSLVKVNIRDGMNIWCEERRSWSDFSFEFVDNKHACLSWVRKCVEQLNSKDLDNPMVKDKITHFISFGYGIKTEIIANPPLNKFPWIFDEKSHREIFQDIEQFLWAGAELSEQKPLTNKIKVESHGFDYKKSFRKEKRK